MQHACLATPQQQNPANAAAHACTQLVPACLPRTAHGGARCRQDLWAAGGFEALLALLKEEAHQVAVLDALAAWLEQVGCGPNLLPDRFSIVYCLGRSTPPGRSSAGAAAALVAFAPTARRHPRPPPSQVEARLVCCAHPALTPAHESCCPASLLHCAGAAAGGSAAG